MVGKNIGSVKIGITEVWVSDCISISMCRTRRNENAVDEDVDHEPARGATYKAELTVPNHYSKHIFVPSCIFAVHLVTGDCMIVVA